MKPANQTWPLLRGIVGAFTVIAKAMMLGALGMAVVGTMSFVTTIYCYGIGVWLGLPAGLIIGIYTSTKTSLEDTLYLFGVSVVCWILIYLKSETVTGTQGDLVMDDLGLIILALAIFFAIYATRKRIPTPTKGWIGGTITFALAIYVIVNWLQHIYSLD